MSKVNWKQVKLLWTISKLVFKMSFTFWIMETTYFLSLYGWHWKATSEVEILADQIASSGVMISFAFFIGVLINIVNYLLSEKE